MVPAAIAGGLFPALAWLWFWLREGSAHPEPRRYVALAFVAGIFSVAVVIPIEEGVASFIKNQFLLFGAWAAIEEITKYIGARLTVLNHRACRYPIDPVLYMVAVALGFAAAENTIFLLSPLAGSTPQDVFITGNLRFIGATLLHVLASATIGVAIALSFYRERIMKREYAFVGVILAIILHSAFNFFILSVPEANMLHTFAFVWIGLAVLLVELEYIKRIRPGRPYQHT